MSLLMGVAGHWKDIAEGLGFDEDHIEDEIDPNNSTDEACLQDCVEQWIDKLQPSWEKLSHVLRDMGEDGLAQQALDRGAVYFAITVLVSILCILQVSCFSQMVCVVMVSWLDSQIQSS